MAIKILTKITTSIKLKATTSIKLKTIILAKLKTNKAKFIIILTPTIITKFKKEVISIIIYKY